MGYSELRKGRQSVVGGVYHLNFSTFNRYRYFEDFWTGRFVCRCLQFCDERGWCRTIAFIVMPDHVHWLVQPMSKDISELVRIVKEHCRKSAFEVRWNRGFYDRGIRSEEDAIEVARYIIANPKRANLVRHVGDYPHWDCIYL